jgi:hypothetical protein
MQIVFQVVEIAPCTERRWYAIGRALEDIEVGDILYGAVSYKDVENVSEAFMARFIVSEILMYGRSVEFVSKGWTAGIYLQGEDSPKSVNIAILVKTK